MQPDKPLITLVGARHHDAPHRVLKPPLQVLSDRKAPCVEDYPAVSVSHRLGQLLAYLFPSLPGDVAALRPFRCVDCVGPR